MTAAGSQQPAAPQHYHGHQLDVHSRLPLPTGNHPPAAFPHGFIASSCLLCVWPCVHTGMSAGLPKFVTVNLSDLEKAFEAGATVDLQSVQDKKLLNISGRDTKLPLKVRDR